MSMKRCPDCGETYSDTYAHCPFCEEEDFRRSAPARRSGKRTTRKSQPSMLSPILVVVILLLAALLIYLLFGDKIAEKLNSDPATPPTEDVTPTPPAPDDGSVVMPGSDVEPEPEPDTVDIAALPETLKVNNPDFTLKSGETYVVKVTSGGSGPYVWSSSDDGVASVDTDGKVTAISAGKAILTVHDQTAKGTVTVYVKGGASAPSTGTTVTTGPAKLSSVDFTLPVGDPDVKLTVSGASGTIVWDADNPNVATVTDKGLVHAVGRGTTNVTATVDGKTLTCIVRVP